MSDTANIGAGVALLQNEDLSLSTRYDLSTAPHFDAQTVSQLVNARPKYPPGGIYTIQRKKILRA